MANVLSRVQIALDTRPTQVSFKKIDALAGKFKSSVDAVQSQLEKAGRASTAMGRKMQNAFGKAEASAHKYLSSIKGVRGAIVSLGAGALAKQTIQQAANFAETQVRLEALSTEYGEFGRIQQLVSQNAKTFNQSQAESASNFSDAYARLRPLGITLDEIQTVYEGFNATALASGTSAAAASGAFLQLSQALGSGRLQGDEFRSIAEQVPGILRLVSAEMGVTVGELKKLGSDGKITSDILINALAKGFEENGDKIQDILDKSPAQKFKAFQNSVSGLSVAVGNELLPVVTPTVEGLTGMLDIFGRLPGPVKTATSVMFGFAASLTAASGAANLLGLKLKPLLVLIGKVGLVAAPFVGVALAIEDAKRRKEAFDDAMRSTSIDEVTTALDKAKTEVESLNEASDKFKNTAYYKGKVADVQDLKDRLDEAKAKVEELTKRRILIIDLKIAADKIAADVQGKTFKGFDALTPKQVDEALILAGLPPKNAPKLKPKSTTAASGQTPLEKQLEASKELSESLQNQTILATALTDQERDSLQLRVDKLAIDKEFPALSEKQRQTLKDQLEALFGQKNVTASLIEQADARKTKEEEIAAAQEAAAQKLQQIYDQIGSTIASGVVDTLSAAVDQTKSLADAAANTLRNVANILLQLGVNTALKSTGLGIFSGLAGFANGGRPPVGKPSIVGERGPELFVPNTSGTIVPNGKFGGGGGATNVVVNVDAKGSSASGDSGAGKQLGGLIGAAVQAELIKQQRPGGLLSR